jgi:hypothetical protein
VDFCKYWADFLSCHHSLVFDVMSSVNSSPRGEAASTPLKDVLQSVKAVTLNSLAVTLNSLAVTLNSLRGQMDLGDTW